MAMIPVVITDHEGNPAYNFEVAHGPPLPQIFLLSIERIAAIRGASGYEVSADGRNYPSYAMGDILRATVTEEVKLRKVIGRPDGAWFA